MSRSAIPKGISNALVRGIPDEWSKEWFQSFITNFLQPMDARNAVAGVGVVIDSAGTPGSVLSTPARISLSTDVQALFNEPYLLATAPTDINPVLTEYRVFKGETNVLNLTDAGSTGAFTVSVAMNGITAAKFRQSISTSVVGNATGATSNVTDIQAAADNTVLQRAAGVLTFAAVPFTALAQIAQNTVLGSITAGLSTPVALSTTQLTALIQPFTASLSGAVPASSGGTVNFLRADGTFATPAYPVGANPTASVGLTTNNGSAATFMRSDAAPAIDQSIVPAWTGIHAFTKNSTTSFPIAGSNASVYISAPSNGVAATFFGPSTGAAGFNIDFYDTTNAAFRGFIGFGTSTITGAAVTDFGICGGASGSVAIGTALGAAVGTRFGAAGNVTINAPSSGQTLTLAPSPAAGELIATSSALTTGAGSSAGTLTNAPSIGNPTKWIKINDNGTIRSIPAW